MNKQNWSSSSFTKRLHIHHGFVTSDASNEERKKSFRFIHNFLMQYSKKKNTIMVLTGNNQWYIFDVHTYLRRRIQLRPSFSFYNFHSGHRMKCYNIQTIHHFFLQMYTKVSVGKICFTIERLNYLREWPMMVCVCISCCFGFIEEVNISDVFLSKYRIFL